ncbi:aldehyde dehydrogenase [Dentipellis sp. KUC8613]|nr:aldehyde dehydrogenase [Dentipellis sp. KUC8613]
MTPFQPTPISALPEIYETLQKSFRSGLARPLAWRKHQLHQLARLAQENKDAFVAALKADLNKAPLETLLGEVGPIVERSIKSAEQLDEWAKPEPVHVEAAWQQSWGSTLYKTPVGVVLVIAPWNYPMVLSLQPLIGAIAAGCCAVVKPSEISSHYSQLLAELFPKYLDPSAYRVVNGGVEETTEVLKLKWDHIFYTGNGRVARIIAAAAAKHLTPVTLELGGKSPVVVDSNYDLKIAAKRTFYGKCTNAGQICVCPDYVLIPRSAQDAFIEALKEVYNQFFPNGPLGSGTLGHIVNDYHYDRLQSMLARTKGEIVLGGGTDGKRVFAPTVIKNVQDGDSMLEEEIFGPFLPIVPVDTIDDAVEFINNRSHPLVLYCFTEDPEVKQKLIDRTRSGNLIFNDTFQQLAVNELPFSGMGESGYGYQIMKYSFDGFTHLRSSIHVPKEQEPQFAARYLPYTAENAELLAGPALNMKIPDTPAVNGNHKL